MPKHVIFTNRAFSAVLAETKENIATETGGVFLGVADGNVWYVIETLDPGPKSIFQAAYFEYDGDYVRHLANKINRLYGAKLDVLGLWHRHPGSMDTFSSTDNGTNSDFARLNNGITISAIVNVDPNFRFSLYSVEINPLIYTKVSYEISDSAIPDELRNVVYHEDLRNQINNIHLHSRSPVKKIRKKITKESFCKYLDDYLKKSDQYKEKHIQNLKNDEADLDFLIENFLVDEGIYCETIGIPYVFDCSNENEAEFTVGNKNSDLKFFFYMALIPDEEESGKQPIFAYNGELYPYKGNLIKSVLEEYKSEIFKKA